MTVGCLLAGATGYIGYHLAHQLGLAGVQTTAAVRDLSSASGDRKTKLDTLQKAGVKLVEAAADDPTEDLVKLLKGFDTIVTAFSGMLLLLLPPFRGFTRHGSFGRTCCDLYRDDSCVCMRSFILCCAHMQQCSPASLQLIQYLQSNSLLLVRLVRELSCGSILEQASPHPDSGIIPAKCMPRMVPTRDLLL